MIAHDNPGDGAYYTVAQAAAKLGVTEQRVRQLCLDKDIEATKKGGRWWVSQRAVHERFAVRPPKVKAQAEGALEESRLMVRELTEANGALKGELERVRASEKSVRQELENAAREFEEHKRELEEELENTVRELEELKRELEEEREMSELHRKKAEVASRHLVETDATIKSLEEQLSGTRARGGGAPLGSEGPRLQGGRDGADSPRRRRRRPPGEESG